MNRIIPWISLTLATAAVIIAITSPVPSDTPVVTTIDTNHAANAQLRSDLATLSKTVAELQRELAQRPRTSDLDQLATRVNKASAPGTDSGVSEEHVRALIQEQLAAQRSGPQQGGGTPPTMEPLDVEKVQAQMKERFALNDEAATALTTAMTDMQNQMKAAFAPGGDRQAAFAAMGEIRKTMEATVDATIPEDKRDDFRNFTREQLGWGGRGNSNRGGWGGGNNRGGGGDRGDRGGQTPAAPAPTDIKDF